MQKIWGAVLNQTLDLNSASRREQGINRTVKATVDVARRRGLAAWREAVDHTGVAHLSCLDPLTSEDSGEEMRTGELNLVAVSSTFIYFFRTVVWFSPGTRKLCRKKLYS